MNTPVMLVYNEVSLGNNEMKQECILEMMVSMDLLVKLGCNVVKIDCMMGLWDCRLGTSDCKMGTLDYKMGMLDCN